ncbi:MAG: hypothetical protein KAW46_05955, partial [candidate division Zixibacteria bacterium]|nr:hypothetical protein [candidate division Zixibacteria bacterium]
DDVDWDALLICYAGHHHGQGSANLRVHVERIASLMTVGSSVAPGLLLSATILALKVSLPVKLMSSVVAGELHQDPFDVVLIVVASMIGLGLLITNRLKNAQLYHLLFKLNKKCAVCNGSAVKKAATDSAKDTTPNGDGVSGE